MAIKAIKGIREIGSGGGDGADKDLSNITQAGKDVIKEVSAQNFTPQKLMDITQDGANVQREIDSESEKVVFDLSEETKEQIAKAQEKADVYKHTESIKLSEVKVGDNLRNKRLIFDIAFAPIPGSEPLGFYAKINDAERTILGSIGADSVSISFQISNPDIAFYLNGSWFVEEYLFADDKDYIVTQISSDFATSAWTNNTDVETKSTETIKSNYEKIQNLLSKISSVYKFMGSVATVADLPTNAEMGDVYDVLDTGDNYAWTGTEWDKLSGIVDLTNYYTKTETDTALALKIDKTSIQETEPDASSASSQVPSAKRIFAMMGEALSSLNTNAKTIIPAINETFAKAAKNYIEDEVLTGDTWIDGKPIYRKIFKGAVNCNSYTYNQIAFSGYPYYSIGKIIRAYGFWHISNNVRQTASPNACMNSNPHIESMVECDAQIIWISMSDYDRNDAPYEIAVEFTKQADY